MSSNRDLQSLIEAGQFRLDLYHRISAIVIDVPPLRERLVDIPLLAQHFLKEIAYRHARPEPMLSDEALAFLMEQAWPGNVRQLRNELENAFAFAEAGIIRPENFSQYQEQNAPAGAHGAAAGVPASDATSLRNAVNQVEERRIRIALEKFAGNKKKVASELGISRSYLYKKLAMMHAAGEFHT